MPAIPPPPTGLTLIGALAIVAFSLKSLTKEDSFVFDITGRHYNARNSDVSLALPPFWGWCEERDDISDYALRAAKAIG